jgi:hypothetical protein
MPEAVAVLIALMAGRDGDHREPLTPTAEGTP